MSFETMRVREVSNQYGPRKTGGANGVNSLDGARNELVIDFAADQPLKDDIYIPAGAQVFHYSPFGTVAGETVTINSVDVTGATRDDNLTWVTVTEAVAGQGGLVEWTVGTSTGRVVIQYEYETTP